MKKNLPFSAFLLFFFIGMVHGEIYYSGSTYQIPFSKCSNLNITAICSLPIAEEEYNFDGCRLTELNTYQALWSCECHDNYILNFRINPRAKNSCTFIFEAIYPISIPPTHEVERHHYYGVIVKNYTIVYNESYRKLYEHYSNLSQKLLTKLKVVESERDAFKQLVNYLREKLGATNATVEELEELVEQLEENWRMQLQRVVAVAGAVILVLVMLLLVVREIYKRRLSRTMKIIRSFRRKQTHGEV